LLAEIDNSRVEGFFDDKKGETIMTGNNNIQAEYQPSQPNPDLKSLDRLVGTWKQSGGIDGQVIYECTEGGFFLIQRVDLEQYGQKIKGIEIIGHVQLFGEEPSKDIKSRFYSFLDGMTLDYVNALLSTHRA
jgi:hypothetical protein